MRPRDEGGPVTQHALALHFMVDHIGEHEDPPRSNNGQFVRYCQSATWLKPPAPKKIGWPWCVAAWVRAWTDAGRRLPYLGAGAYQTLDWYKKNLPAWVVPVAHAKPGAAVVFNIGAGHLAMLESVDARAATVTTIGGNESDSVKRTTRSLTLVRGVVDPPEKVTAPIPIAKKPPIWEVVTSDSGHKVVYVSGVKAISNKLPQLLKRYGKGLIIRPRKTK